MSSARPRITRCTRAVRWSARSASNTENCTYARVVGCIRPLRPERSSKAADFWTLDFNKTTSCRTGRSPIFSDIYTATADMSLISTSSTETLTAHRLEIGRGGRCVFQFQPSAKRHRTAPTFLRRYRSSIQWPQSQSELWSAYSSRWKFSQAVRSGPRSSLAIFRVPLSRTQGFTPCPSAAIDGDVRAGRLPGLRRDDEVHRCFHTKREFSVASVSLWFKSSFGRSSREPQRHRVHRETDQTIDVIFFICV